MPSSYPRPSAKSPALAPRLPCNVIPSAPGCTPTTFRDNAGMPFAEHDNCRLSYALTGPDAGTPVVLIQGVGVAGAGWLPQTEFLAAQGFRCLTFDNRGLGQSQSAAGPVPFGAPVTVAQMARDTLALMDAAGMPRAHLVGHSLGGLIAAHLALTARPRVRSLTLMCTFANGATALQLTPRMFWLGTRSRVGTRRARRHAFLQIVMPPDFLRTADRPALADKLARYFGHDLADHPPVTSHQLRALKSYDATPRLHELAGIPTLILAAAHDPIARPADAGRVLHQKIPASRYLEFPDASHGLPLQWPERVNAALLEHLRQASRQGAPLGSDRPGG